MVNGTQPLRDVERQESCHEREHADHCAHDGNVESSMCRKSRECQSDTLARVDVSEHDEPEGEEGQDRGLHLGHHQHEDGHTQRSKDLQRDLIHKKRSKERRGAISAIRNLAICNITLLMDRMERRKIGLVRRVLDTHHPPSRANKTIK